MKPIGEVRQKRAGRVRHHILVYVGAARLLAAPRLASEMPAA
jgi:hypothetical protein